MTEETEQTQSEQAAVPAEGAEAVVISKAAALKNKRAASTQRKALTKAEATAKADVDARRMPEEAPEVQLVPGKTPTLCELRQLSRKRDRDIKDRNREITRAVAQATQDTLVKDQNGVHKRIVRRTAAELAMKAAERRGE